KSMTGHLLGAAGAVESIATILAMRDGIVPPTINLVERDENMPADVPIAAGVAVTADISVAMSNTFGFGGHNAIVVFKKLA
ncbi:MAG TPA: beta-ketoacyl-[acyl-carrier-protein] synthase II, partial [Bacteroidetes bacterium]|nr:beta-ketoacyl-[acyl-carrier-protein] synthase II [Bacteroidota bacterium]